MIEIPPRFRVAPAPFAGPVDGRTLVLHRSSAFGDGQHETTRMCVQALSVFAPREPFRVLDVGSGSGILSIAAAKLGAEAHGVETDEAANAVARENARASGVEGRATFGTAWPAGRFEVVLANILRGVLLDLAEEIAARIASPGLLVLSGLVSTDVPEIVARYSPLVGVARPEVFERGPWRALVFRPGLSRT